MTTRLIGLTGGIATGKSTCANYLQDKYHLPILDADIYSRAAVNLGSPILGQIHRRYGENILLADGTLNRQALGEIIFNNTQEKEWVEQQIHPFVRQRFQEELSRLNEPTVVLVIPLLFEAKLEHTVTEIWVVFCSQSEQIQRLVNRNNLSLAQAEARIKQQLPLADKLTRADVRLDNNSADLTILYKQIDVALQEKVGKAPFC